MELVRCLVELTRKLEDIDREFTAQMLSMESRMTGALMEYSKSLVAGAPLPDPPAPALAPSPSTPSSDASMSEREPVPAKTTLPPRAATPRRLVNDLVLLDIGLLTHDGPPAPVGNVLRDESESGGTSDDHVPQRTDSPRVYTPVHEVVLPPPPPHAALLLGFDSIASPSDPDRRDRVHPQL